MKRIFYFILAAVTVVLAACGGQNEPEPQPEPQTENGAFTVGDGKKVEFAQSNLCYNSTTDKWSFVYQIVPSGTDNWVFLFDWGTVNNQTSFDGLEAGEKPWRIPSKDEWEYLFFKRPHADQLFGFGCISGVNGIIILPDNFEQPKDIMFIPVGDNMDLNDNNPSDIRYDPASLNYGYQSNIFVASGPNDTWKPMADNGAIFLPVTGYREDGYPIIPDIFGGYWSSTQGNSNDHAYSVYFNNNPSLHLYDNGKEYGLAVRLVR